MPSKYMFPTLLNEVSTTQKEFPMGCLRLEPDDKEPLTGDPAQVFSTMAGFLWRERRFRYIQNISGGTLNKDSLVMADDLIVATVTATTNTDATKLVRASGNFITDGIKAGDLAYVLDDAGGAGAAPEGEFGVVLRVEALTITLQTALTAAVTASDTVNFLRPWTIKASATGQAGAGRLVGIPMANIATGSYGWIQVSGYYPTADIVAAGTAIVTGSPLYAGTGLLTPVAPVITEGTPNVIIAGTNYRAVAEACHAVTTDTVRRKALVYLCGH